MNLSDILTDEVIQAALDAHWHGTANCCPFCGKPRYMTWAKTR